MRKAIFSTGVSLALLLVLAVSLQASSITFTVSNSGSHVYGTADFTTSAGEVLVTLTNTFAEVGGIDSVASAITGVAFVLSNGGSATLIGDLGRLVEVASGGAFTDAVGGSGADDLDWSNNSPNGATWNGGSGPDQSILPPQANYATTGGSIKGNGPHNPFVYGSALLTFSSSGTTADTTITSATIYFGTDFTPFEASPPPPPPGVPEPSTLFLLGSGLIGMASIVRKRKK